MARLAHEDPVVACDEAGTQLLDAARRLDDAIEHVASTIDPERGHVSDAVVATLAPPADDGLARCIASHAQGDGVPPLALLWAREFVATVQQRVLTLERAAAPAADVAATS